MIVEKDYSGDEKQKNNNMDAIKDFIVLIPCYNNLHGLLSSVSSVQYPYDKFEILIVDDGSATPITIDDFQQLSEQLCIKIIRLEKNMGIVNALNTGLKELQNRNDFKYIARLDAGDCCMPDRFTLQVA